MSRNNLNQATKDFIASLPVPDAPLGAMSLGDFRQLQRDLNVQFSGDIPRDIETIDQQISGQNAKIHRTQDYNSRTMPTLLYIAGGAFVCSGLDNPAPKKMADGAQVIMLGHRLAPEHKISDSVDDIVNGIIYCLENSAQLNIGENIIIGGDSSGASFALAAMLNLRDSHPDMLAKIKHMVFISPAVDLSMAPQHCREYDEQDALFSAEAVTAVQT
ncbi:MAG: alpha/beta hydrolase, partial [Candidatus Thioglobus sp.]